ncbi:MAG: hypothetical protein U1E76_02820 [Planctomycetota bacterium]
MRLVDVMPTLLDWLDLEGPALLDGASFAAALRDPAARLQVRRLYAEGIMPGDEVPDPYLLRSYQQGELKLILDFRRREKLLFDLDRDPGEHESVLRARPLEAERLLHLLIDQHQQNCSRALSVASVALDPGNDRRLLALGYAGSRGLQSVDLARRELVPFEIAPLGLIGDERDVAKYVATLDFGAEFPREQLLYGWWQADGGSRWMATHAAVRLKRNAGQTEWYVNGSIDLALHGVAVLTIQVSIDGAAPLPCKIEQSGAFTLSGPLPALEVPLNIDLAADHAFVPALQGKTDVRSLTIVVTQVGLR